MTGKIRILVVDDHPVVREGLAAILQTQPDFEVIGEAATGLEAVRLVGSAHPDIVLLDLEMPEMDGVEALQQMRMIQPEIKALVFTAFDTDERIVGSLRAGAAGYLLKGAPREEVFNAIRVISQGGSLLGPVVVTKLLERISSANRNQASSSSDDLLPAPLTAREDEVLHLLAQGLTNKEIAERLVVTERTVKFHVSSVLRKLGAANRTEAVSIAAQRGLVSL
jgi:DNA-binding NarL/FixJ family response regulator